MDKDEALRMALKSLEFYYDLWKEKVDAQTITAIREALAQSDQESDDLTIAYMSGVYDGKNKYAPQPEQEPVAWRNAAIRVGEDLCSVGPFGYYDMTAKQWLDWALSVVTVHAPPPRREWVGLTDEEYKIIRYGNDDSGERYISEIESYVDDCARAIEAKLREKNGG